MKLTNYIKILSGVIIAIAISSCSVATVDNELSVPNQTFSFEDVFEGSNTANSIELDLNPIISAEEKLKGKEVESVNVKSITLTKNDSIGFSEISSVKMQVMGDGEDAPMLTVGVLNKVDSLSKSIELEIVDEVELEEYIEAGKIYLILDGDFKPECEEYQDVDASINFNVKTVKE